MATKKILEIKLGDEIIHTEEVHNTINIKYNNNVIANISGVGSKKLKCKGKYMSDDITLVEQTGETWIINENAVGPADEISTEFSFNFYDGTDIINLTIGDIICTPAAKWGYICYGTETDVVYGNMRNDSYWYSLSNSASNNWSNLTDSQKTLLRTITFAAAVEEGTALYTWLQTNAVKQ